MNYTNIQELIKSGETVHFECKEASFGLPNSVFETYSSMTNTDGGIVLLGIKENKDNHSFEIVGVKDEEKIINTFWNGLNNPEKVSENILIDKNVYPLDIEDKRIIVIEIPRANYNSRPVYINGNPYSGTYKRNNEGDYHSSKDEVNSMIRDKSSDGNDGVILEGYSMDYIDIESLEKYRNVFSSYNLSHVWLDLPLVEFLEKLGGWAKDDKENIEGLTIAGFLMFGKGDLISNKFSHLFMDYRDESFKNDDVRWIDRITYDGTWECNLYNFFMKVNQKLTQDLPKPFHLEGIYRIDDTPVHKAVREALINMIIHADYFIQGTLKVIKRKDCFEISNPGILKLSREQIYKGGDSAARNPTIQKMFRMIGLGDNAGSGFPTILSVWEKQGYIQPDLKEDTVLNQVKLTLPFKKPAIKTGDKKPAIKTGDKKQAIKTSENKKRIISFMQDGKSKNINEIMELLNLGKSRTRELLNEMIEDGLIEAEGSNKNRKYKINS